MSRSSGIGARIDARFAALKAEGRAAFVPYVMAGDPDRATAQAILDGLPGAGADLIELGMPFTDPMADGPSVDAAGQRALKAGITVDATFDMVRRFRKEVGKGGIVVLNLSGRGDKDVATVAAHLGMEI